MEKKYIFNFWNTGIMECWDYERAEYRSIGVMEYWVLADKRSAVSASTSLPLRASGSTTGSATWSMEQNAEDR